MNALVLKPELIDQLNKVATRRNLPVEQLLERWLEREDLPINFGHIFIEQATEAFFAVNRDWDFIYANAQAEQLLNYTRGEMLGNNIWELFPEAVNSTFYKEYHRAFETRQVMSFIEFYPPLDTWFEVHAYPSDDYLAIYFRDVTRRVLRERKLRENQRVLQLIMDHIPIILFAVDTNGTLVSMDGSGLDLINVSKEVLTGVNIFDTFSNRAIHENMNRAIQGEMVNFELMVGQRPFETWYVPLRNADGEVDTVLGVGIDMSDRAQKQRLQLEVEELRQLDQIKTRFMSTVSHEFRTPLAVLQTSSEILTRYADHLSEERRQRHLENITEQVAHLTQMLAQVESALQVQLNRFSMSPNPVNVVSATTDIVNQMQQLEGSPQTIHLKVSGRPIPVHVDVIMLRQIMRNLLDNALRYSEREINVRLNFLSNGLQIQVEDYGIGIDPDDHDKVFSLFYRGKNAETIPGTGLGLNLVQHHVKAHGGEIHLESALNIGTTITVTLPYKPPAQDAISQES